MSYYLFISVQVLGPTTTYPCPITSNYKWIRHYPTYCPQKVMVWLRQALWMEFRSQIIFLIFNFLDTSGSSLHFLCLVNLQPFLLSASTGSWDKHTLSPYRCFCFGAKHRCSTRKEIITNIMLNVMRSLCTISFLQLLLFGINNHSSVAVFYSYIWETEHIFLWVVLYMKS